jgi:hypothetical protein
MHARRVAEKWKAGGKKYVYFLQNGNALAFRSFLPVLGVSAKNDMVMNSICVSRKAEARTGAMCVLTPSGGGLTGRTPVMVNVEHDLLQNLLTEELRGNDANGHSPFPGTVNQFIVRLDEYTTALDESKGKMKESVHPEFHESDGTDPSSPRLQFTTSARLECNMQDLPWVLPAGSCVGFTQCPEWMCFAPITNDAATAANLVKQGLSPACASAAEHQFYEANARMLQAIGVQVIS